VKRGSQLKSPVKKAAPRKGWDGEIDLATGRIERKPITKPNAKH
jgi:hypothetical protein